MIASLSAPEELSPWEPTALGCRVFSLARSYGVHSPFARFWAGDGCGFSLCDGVLTMAGTPEDPEESDAFARFCGAHTLVCEETAGNGLGFSVRANSHALSWEQPPSPEAGAPPLAEVSPRAFYALLSACRAPGFPVPEFEPFYLDLSHRTRHGGAALYGFFEGETLAAGLTVCLTEHSTLIFSGAVLPEKRGQGLYAALLKAAAHTLAGRKILLCCREELLSYYRALGFVRQGGILELKIP